MPPGRPRRRGALNRATRLLAVLAVLGAAAPATAWAHAELLSTVPDRGAFVRREPATVSLRFSERVTGSPDAVRVSDAHGKRIDEGNAYHPGGHGAVYAVRLKPGVPKGTYTATYRVVSDDTHVVTGGYSFAIGTSLPHRSAISAPGAQRSGPVTSTAFTVVRAVQYGAIGLAAGILAFLFAVWVPVLRRSAGGAGERSEVSARLVARVRGMLLLIALAGVVSGLAGLVLEGAQASGVTAWRAVDGAILSGVLGGRFGVVWAIGTAAWIVILAGAVALRSDALGADGRAPAAPRVPVSMLLLAVPAAALVSLPALAGHASIEHSALVFVPVNLVHVAAMSVWLGGLVMLVIAVPAATRVLDGNMRLRLLSQVLGRFSPAALGAVLVLLLTGVVQALLEVDAWPELWHTAYGRVVLLKVALLAALIGLGAIHRRRTLPRIRGLVRDGATPVVPGLLQRTLAAEVAVLAAVLVATAALAAYAPAKTVGSGSVHVSSTVGPVRLSMEVDPGRVGTNAIRIDLVDRRTGARYAKARRLALTATLPGKRVGTLTLTPHHAGPGKYTVSSAAFGTPGTWSVGVTVLLSNFAQHTTYVPVRIR